MKTLKKMFTILLLTTFFVSPIYLYAERLHDVSNNPSITLTPNISVDEGDSGTKTVSVTITIDECPDTHPIKIDYYTLDEGGSSGARVSDNDYIEVPKTLLVFTKDSCTKSKTVDIEIKGDTKLEEDETFYFKIEDKGTSSAQPYTIVDDHRNIKIKNDEVDKRADLHMNKSSNITNVNLNTVVIYTLLAKNLGPYKSRIKVVDTLPAGLEYVSVSDNSGNFNCTYSHGSRKLTCDGPKEFNKNEQVDIKVKVKVTVSGPTTIRNTAVVSSPDSRVDPKLWNNTNSRDIYVGVPGGTNSANISKTVNDATPEVGDTLTFTIKVTNVGFDKRIAFRDKFPKDGDDWGTTGGAFDLISIVNPTPGVTCENKTHKGDPYVVCYTDAAYTHNQSFTVKLLAKVKKKGRVCNRAFSYEYPWINKDWESVCMDVTGNFPPTLAPIPDQWTQLGPFTMDPNEVSFYANDADGDTLTYAATGLPPGLSIDTSTGVISGTSTTLGTFTVNITIDDDNGGTASDSFIINVINPPLKATPNIYNTKPGIAVNGNFITDNTGNGIDTGVNIQFLSHTPIAEGTLSVGLDGTFVYTPESTTVNTMTFTYTIRDDFGDEDTATVTINIGTDYYNGTKEFELINPPQTRNIIGDYIIMGNTITCITNKTNTYDGTCQNNKKLNNNEYMSKYLDIDSDSSTWNSSSSNFKLPNNYDQLGGQGILWAALFWQGGIHNKYTDHPQRRAYASGAAYNYTNITSSKNLNLEATDGNKILLKVNDEANYTPLQATSFYYDSAHGDKGGYYAAYRDVTRLLKSKNLAKGDHTITVANITTNEGRDEIYGNYGGWSLVIIYKQDDLNGDPRNISIYNGYQALSSVPGGTSSKDIKISGFKLPKSGPIKAKFSAFSGEGEAVYGGLGTINHDKMIIKRTLGDTNPKDMPGAADTDNIFDAKLANINRDTAKHNAIVNTNGIDIDVYNVSGIMEDYRDLDQNISSLYIGLSTSDDYITPSMLAFSTELYQPNICYDYTQDIDGYILESKGNVIRTSYGSYSKYITTRISIKSKEGDFALEDVNLTYRIHDSSHIKYTHNSTAIAPNDLYAYIPAGTSGLDQTYAQTPKGFSMYIGRGASKQPDGPGGVIDAYETRYFKFDQTMYSSSIDTRFDLWIEYNIDYGSGKLTLGKTFGESSICQDESGYYPAWGHFNISSDEADETTGEPYNLYTQIANRDFNARITSYDDDFSTPKEAKTAIEVELFNAGLFSRDTNVSCNNPDANISNPVFIQFNDQFSVPLENLRYNIAIRNAGFRIWHLTKEDGSVIEFQCADRNDEACFQKVYTDAYTTDTNCNVECNAGGSGCYPCLRTYYGKPVCSRDNFAIRPEAFVTTLVDSNQSVDTTKDSIGIAESRVPSTSSLANSAKLAAGYAYRFDINATNFLNDDATPGYIQQFNTSSGSAVSKMKWSPSEESPTTCNDVEDQNITVTLFDGTSLNTYANIAPVDHVAQVGEYAFTIEDENWTAVDWNEELTKHHLMAGFVNDISDCTKDDNTVLAVGTGKQGCTISSVHSHPAGHAYTALALRYYPYTFNVDAIGSGAGTDNARNFVYINTLSAAPHGRDENMSYNIFGTFKAADYTGNALSNFVDGCYADPVDMTLYHTYLSDIPTSTPNLSFDLIDFNTTQPSIITSPRRQGSFSDTILPGQKAPLKVTQPSSAFSEDMKGAISMDLGFNFNRANNDPLNPRRIHFTDFNITYGIPPDTLDTPDISVDMITDYKISGNKKVDDNVTFFYARAKAQQSFYDDITENSVITPISVVVYCDLGFVECQNRGVMAAFAQTSEFDWWKSWNHNSTTDGKIEIKSTPSTALNNTSVNINTKGENDTITVSKDSTAPLPQTIPINFVTGAFPMNYTDRWLIYNSKDATAIPSPFYRVRFIGGSGWAGHGDTGHVVGGESNTKKSKRLEW